MNQKSSKSAFAILEVVVALALTLLVASVVFFYGRIIIENSKISKLKSDIDLTVSSIKNGFYSVYEKYPGQLSLEEIQSSFFDDKGTLSCGGAGTSDVSCYSSNYFDADDLSFTNGANNYYEGTPYNPKVKNAINQLILSGNAPRGLVDLSRFASDLSDGNYTLPSTWSVVNKFHDQYEIPFNSSFKGYWFPFTNRISGFSYFFNPSKSLLSGNSQEQERRLGLKSYYISINGKDLFASSDNYRYANLTQNPIITKQQAYKFSQKFMNSVVVGYADSNYHLVKPGYVISTNVYSVSNSYCNTSASDYYVTVSSSSDADLSTVTINTSGSGTGIYPRDIKYGCSVVAKVGWFIYNKIWF